METESFLSGSLQREALSHLLSSLPETLYVNPPCLTFFVALCWKFINYNCIGVNIMKVLNVEYNLSHLTWCAEVDHVDDDDLPAL